MISCASQTFDARGLAFGLASNCCFAARSIYVSMLQDRLPYLLLSPCISLWSSLLAPLCSLARAFATLFPLPPHTHPFISLHLPRSPHISLYLLLQDRLKRERAEIGGGMAGMGPPSSSAQPPHESARRELSSSTVFFYQHLLGLLLMVPCSLLEDARCPNPNPNPDPNPNPNPNLNPNANPNHGRCSSKIALPSSSNYATQSVLGA